MNLQKESWLKMICYKIDFQNIDFSTLLFKDSIFKKKNNYKYRNKKIKNLGDLLLQYSIYKNFGIPSNDWEIKYNDFGKPLVIAKKNVYYSISYSNNWIICIVNDKPVGIDLEHVNEIDYQLIIKYFHSHEVEQINKMQNKLSEFYRIWTLKESYLKLLGTGLYKELNTFNIVSPDVYIDDIRINTFHKEIENYSVAISSFQNINNLKIKNINLEEIRSYIEEVYKCY